MTNNLSLRIPEELDKSLIYIAKKLDRSKSYIVKEALKEYIVEMMENIEDSEIALARSDDPDEVFYTSEEFAKLVEERH